VFFKTLARLYPCKDMFIYCKNQFRIHPKAPPPSSDIEAPFDDVAVAHDVFFAFDAQLASLAGLGF